MSTFRRVYILSLLLSVGFSYQEVEGGAYSGPGVNSASSSAISSASSNGGNYAVTSTQQSGNAVGNAEAGVTSGGGGYGSSQGPINTSGYGGSNNAPANTQGYGEAGSGKGPLNGQGIAGGASGVGPANGQGYGPVGTSNNFPLTGGGNSGIAGKPQTGYQSSSGAGYGNLVPAAGKPPVLQSSGDIGGAQNTPLINGAGGYGGNTGSTLHHTSTSYSSGSPSSGGVYTSAGIPNYGGGSYGSGYASTGGFSSSVSGSPPGLGFPGANPGAAAAAAADFQKVIENYMQNLYRLHQAQINSVNNIGGYPGSNDIMQGGPNPNVYANGFSQSGSYSGSSGGFTGAWAGPGGAGTFQPGGGSLYGPGSNGPFGTGGIGAGGYSGHSGVQPGGFTGSHVGASSSASLGPQGGHGSAHIHPSDEGLDLRFGQPFNQGTGGGFQSVFSSSSSGSSTVNGQTTSYKKSTFTVNDNGNITTYSVSDP